MRRLILATAAIAALCVAAPQASLAAKQTTKKSIWGPTQVEGKSQFPIYRELGVGIFQMQLEWANVAKRRPASPRNPSDPAYRWPSDVTYALKQARKNGMRVSLTVFRTPRWANGGRGVAWAPKRASDYADFLEAASKRYPAVRHWMIWGEPSRTANFKPMPKLESSGPRRYARLLDAAYKRLKKVRRSNLVIGGNTFTTGDVPPKKFIQSMKLRNGRRPRMDMYGHNPFGRREPDLRKKPLGFGYADFSDLDTLAHWLDRAGYRRPGGRGKLRLFLSEYTAPTDHPNSEFNFYVTRETQARWAASALRITRRWHRIYTLGWFGLYDEPPTSGGDEVNRGLLTYRGLKKPSFAAFKRG